MNARSLAHEGPGSVQADARGTGGDEDAEALQSKIHGFLPLGGVCSPSGGPRDTCYRKCIEDSALAGMPCGTSCAGRHRRR